ncbi:MAG: hypothetical protein HQL24_07395 [Candidatus Omnitrophica bacterium]|nr:hypothetical protein [Candidatus Omnitrophota bacterium]
MKIFNFFSAKGLFLLFFILFIFTQYKVFLLGYQNTHCDYYTFLVSQTYLSLEAVLNGFRSFLWQPYVNFGEIPAFYLTAYSPFLCLIANSVSLVFNLFHIYQDNIYPLTYLSQVIFYFLVFVLGIYLMICEIISDKKARFICFICALFGAHFYRYFIWNDHLVMFQPFFYLFVFKILKGNYSNPWKIIFCLTIAAYLSFTGVYLGFYLNVLLFFFFSIVLSCLLRILPVQPLFSLIGKLKGFSFKQNLLLALALIILFFSGLAQTFLTSSRLSELYVVPSKGVNMSNFQYVEAVNRAKGRTNLPLIKGFMSEYSPNSGIDNFFGPICILIVLISIPFIRNRFFLISIFTGFLSLLQTTSGADTKVLLDLLSQINPLLHVSSRYLYNNVIFAIPFIIALIGIALETFFQLLNSKKYSTYLLAVVFLLLGLAIFLRCSYSQSYWAWIITSLFLAFIILIAKTKSNIKISFFLIALTIFIQQLSYSIHWSLDKVGLYSVRTFSKYYPKKIAVEDSTMTRKYIIASEPTPLLCHSFPYAFNFNNINVTDYTRASSNGNFKYFTPDFDVEFRMKGYTIQNLPFLKLQNKRLFFVNNLAAVNDERVAINLTAAVYRQEKAGQLAILSIPNDEANKLKDSVAKKYPAPFGFFDLTFLRKEDVKNVGELPFRLSTTKSVYDKEIDEMRIDLNGRVFQIRNVNGIKMKFYDIKLPESFPKYLNTNFLNSDYKNIVLSDSQGKTYLPTYFNDFSTPNRFQISYKNYRRMTLAVADDAPPAQLVLRWVDYFKKEGIKIVNFNNDRLELETNLEDNKFLVFADRFAQRWHFYLDGKPDTIYRTNLIFKGVFVPKGTHKLVFQYEDPVLLFTVFIVSLAHLGGIFFVAGYLCRQKDPENIKL